MIEDKYPLQIEEIVPGHFQRLYRIIAGDEHDIGTIQEAGFGYTFTPAPGVNFSKDTLKVILELLP